MEQKYLSAAALRGKSSEHYVGCQGSFSEVVAANLDLEG